VAALLFAWQPPLLRRQSHRITGRSINLNVTRDMWLMGVANILFGAFGFVSGAAFISGFASPLVESLPRIYLFGIFPINSLLWQGVGSALHGLAFVVGGWGLLRGRAYGWWVTLLMALSGVRWLLDKFVHYPYGCSIWFAILALVVAWLLRRARFYRPFGRKRLQPDDVEHP